MSQHQAGRGILALEVDGEGTHPAAWRVSGRAPGGVLAAARTLEAVQAAESAGFHAVTFEDSRLLREQGPARLDAVQRAAFAAPRTRSVALVPVLDAVYTEPFHVATQLASLDHISAGRAGWIVSAAGTAEEGAAVGRAPLTGDALAQEAADAVETSRLLWDSWEDGAVIRDVAAGRYLDAGKLHYANFRGRTFSVKGPAIIPRPPQGQLPVFAPAGLLAPGTGQGADAALVSAAAPELLLNSVAAHAAAGSVIAELEVVLDSRGRSAADRLAELDGWEPGSDAVPQRARLAGSAAELADYLAQLLGTAAGVRLFPAVLDTDLEELGQLVLPRLRAWGLLAQTAPERTFRDLLGLPRPANRFAAAGRGHA
ncbi:LLM class flavin-dependent oxidoreductase [Arthrobacter sp. Sa2CUA1]|uniref:LLM class flavin-dependent oxidoreductase n=1 Tax=Arthrobacter gallicola TaxID=2762225 RepID=A0ABR8UQD7_9MICC|nr:LLM class flavin-dependent oxidoreductase [Arthrobacter gallicola]MBD7994749.1 LLM class flavin-dependent oxidoreductase [Arthrobacter gallicola]